MNKHNQNRIDFYEDVMSLLKQYNLTKDDLLEVFGCTYTENDRIQQAIEKYPEGTVVKCLLDDEIYTITCFDELDGTYMWFKTLSCVCLVYYGESNEWAEIIKD